MIFKIVIYTFFTVSANLILRYSGQNAFQYNISIIGIQLNLATILAVFCYGCGFLLLINLLQNNAITYITPIMAVLVNGFIVVGAVVIFKENLSYTQIVGLLFGAVSIAFLVT